MSMHIMPIIDLFLPPAERQASPDRRRQGRVLVSFSAGMALSTVAALPFVYPLTPRLLALDLATFGGYVAALAVVRLRGVSAFAALLTCSTCFLCFAFVGIHRDGLLAIIHPFNLVVPLLAIYVGGTRMGIGFAVVLVTEIVVTLLLHQHGLALASDIMPRNKDVALVCVGALAVPVVAFLSALHRSATESAEKALSDSLTALAAREVELRSALETTELIISNAPFALVLVGKDRTIRQANNFAGEILKSTPNDLVGQSWGRFIAGPANADVTGNTKEAIATDAQGKAIPLLISAIPARINGEEVSIEAFVDLSAQKRLEARLRQAQKLESVGRLAAGVSHEINNPLGVILGFAQGMERRVGEGDPLRLPVTSIVREALRCKAIVQEMLKFSRNEKRSMETVEFNTLVDAAALLLDARATTQNVRLVKDLARDLPPIMVNKTQMEQVLVNLGTNALDAMRNGGVLTLRTRRIGRDGNQGKAVLLEVADTGMGIPEEIRSRVFEPFFTTKKVGDGTGLGLSLVHEMVQQQGGVVDLESEVDQGTTVRIQLPGIAANAASST